MTRPRGYFQGPAVRVFRVALVIIGMLQGAAMLLGYRSRSAADGGAAR